MANRKPKKCEYCGKEYIPKSNNSKYCPGPHYATCPICGKKFQITNEWYYAHPIKSCSSYECRKKAREKTSLERYGITAPGNNPEARKKASNTMMERLGVPYAMMSEDVRKKSEKTIIEKYGVDNVSKNEDIKKKRRETVLKRYNGIYPFNSEEVRQKQRETLIQHYGVPCAFSSPEIREKSRRTMQKRYNVDHYIQDPNNRKHMQDTIERRYGVREAFSSKQIRDKSKETWLEKYGVDNPGKSKKLNMKAIQTRKERYPVYEGSSIQKKYTETMMKKYGVPYSCLLPSAQSKYTKSKANYEFLTYLQDNGIDVHETDMEFHIGRRSYDFKIPESDILIELDPTYTHNALGNHFNRHGMTTTYHLMKTKLARENGYRCIHVFDWNSWDDILSLISPKKRVYARNTDIYMIKNMDLVHSFLNENHLQGTVRGQKLCIGLVKDDELLELMTFGKPRYNNNYDSELLRLCTKKGIQVTGGASKLFSYVTKYFGLGKIISYCDLSKFNGKVYENIGMNLIRNTSPSKIWSKKSDYITSNTLSIKGFDNLFGTNYGKGTDNEELMLENGWLPVYDCGQAVYEYDAGC